MKFKAVNSKRKYSMQTAFIAAFFLVVSVMMVLLNTYPTISSRDAVFASKQNMMVSQVTLMSSSLSALDSLNSDNVEQVMELVDMHSYDRVMVTDTWGMVLYDTAEKDSAFGKYALFSDIDRSLGGEVLFNCVYDGSAFSSSAAAPVVNLGTIIGSIYLYEYDDAQAKLISGVQARLRGISGVVCILAFMIILVLTNAITRRLRDLVQAMHIVREGDYDYRIAPKGGDEITELAEEFNDMTQRLQSTEELRRRFVSDASHELRTPLASIRLLSDSIVQSDNMDLDTMREFVTDIGSEAERLQRMTEKLMKLTKMDSGITSKKELLDVKEVVEKTIHLLKPLAENKNVSIHTQMEEGCFILGNEDDIYQIIFNLAENALKYNVDEGSVFLRLLKEDKNIVFAVEDTGIGIPAEDVPHIFSRFYRVDKARSSEVGGSGLGLSIVYDAVIQNGGSIKVEARKDVGTCFVVSFPFCGAANGGDENE